MTHSGANVIVTGANRGIGRALVDRLANNPPIIPLTIIACARQPPGGIQLSSVPNVKIEWYPLDISSTSSIQHFIWELNRRLSNTVDVLINNAGVNYDSQAPFAFSTCADTLRTNLDGTYALTRALLPLLRRPGHPALCSRSRILNISSTGGKVNLQAGYSPSVRMAIASVESMPQLHYLVEGYKDAFRTNSLRAHGWPVGKSYSVSKAFMNAMTRILASENSDILINSCCPGWVRTDMGGRMAFKDAADGARIPATLAFDPTMKASGFFWETQSLDDSEEGHIRPIQWIE